VPPRPGTARRCERLHRPTGAVEGRVPEHQLVAAAVEELPRHPFPLRRASEGKNGAVGHVLRGLYLGLAVILMAAIRGNRSLAWALLDGGIGVFLILLTYVVFDRLDPRDFGRELAADNTMLGMEIEGLFILTAAVLVGAMNLVAF